MRLAERLGMTLRQLEREMDGHELAEWMAFDELEREQPTTKSWKLGGTRPS